MEITTHIKTFKLSQLTGSIERMFSQHFREKLFWVIADVTDHTFQKNSGRRYFALVEKKQNSSDIVAKVQAVVWESFAQKIDDFEKATGQKFQSGLQVLVKVSVNYHSNYGIKLNVVDISSEFTIGNLARQREETLKQLLRDCPSFIRKMGETYHTFNKGLAYKPVIQRIALVTSATAAGYEDFKNTIEHNSFGYRFCIDKYYTLVQGDVNAAALCSRLHDICASKVSYDAVIIIRGGGSQTDFLIFDNYELCRTIASFPFPIITGIGHHRNESIADLMAHTVAKTPTEAAEFIIAHNQAFEKALLDLRNKIASKSKTIVAGKMLQQSHLQSLIVNKSRDIIARHKEEQTNINQAITSAAQKMLYDKRSELQATMSSVIANQKLVIIHKSNEIAALVSKVKLSSKTFHFKHQDLSQLGTSIFNNARNLINHSKAESLNNYQTITNSARSILYKEKLHLSMVSQQISIQSKQIVKDHQKELSNLSTSIKTNSEKYLAGQNKSLDTFVSILRVMSPANILRKGFAIVFHDGKIITNGESIPDGSQIKIRFTDTVVESVTKNKTKPNDRDYII
ncbi:exodeoxyribonuclease VII large subunit [Chitinophagaceae bacterium LB-8]|uniref:Exodeoxyribonuclease VII large subunit n=1 Tax=Paraflavisolibacter caeni TaxID=2982496 RepID=A0A9X3BIU7_9BACT|nr:exodeoxyribonuclease VII large subunit [Paraflavisolibacter caeni]MCU7550448.1 exodeoxyribonuclease VII large subunit [Paraflavisolibacter caeni]